MPPPSRRNSRQNHDSDDDGYEVVESQPRQRARIVRSTPSQDGGFEVVDEEEVTQIKKPKRRVVAVEDDEDDTVQSVRQNDETDERPRKKKKKKRRSSIDEEVPTSQMWWVLPLVLILVGLILSIVGAIGVAGKSKNPAEVIGTGIILTVTLIQFVVSIPVSIIALVVGGKLFGIEYGTPLMAVANIAAIGSMMMGLDWFLTWLGLWGSAVFAITFVTGFSLFMTLFQLDSWEVWVSIFCIKAVTFLSYIAVFVLVLAALIRGGGNGGDFNHFDPDEDQPKLKQKKDRTAERENQPRNRGGRPLPDDDDD